MPGPKRLREELNPIQIWHLKLGNIGQDMIQRMAIHLIKYKSEAFEKFKEFKNEVEKQTGKSIKILRLDRGGEYLSTEFLEYLKKHFIISQWTPPETPQLNGVFETRN
ncbi:unnamed protein product [Prunus armeniaca]